MASPQVRIVLGILPRVVLRTREYTLQQVDADDALANATRTPRHSQQRGGGGQQQQGDAVDPTTAEHNQGERVEDENTDLGRYCRRI